MASTTDELTSQSEQLMSALGFFRTSDSGPAQAVRPAAPKPNGGIGKLNDAVARHPVPASKKVAKSGVALRMRETTDHVDKEFERY
jgi:hypothetical protein